MLARYKIYRGRRPPDDPVQGSSVKIEVKDGKVNLDNAQVVKTDILCTNGVIHIIDNVILPQ